MHKRYADPLPMLWQWASVGALSEFCGKFWVTVKEEAAHADLWEIWLHKDFEHSWEDFTAELDRKAKVMSMTDQDKSAIVAQSYEILKDFQPT